MITEKKTAIVILAAGKGSRMQMPKQMLKWGDGTLLQHTVKVVSAIENAAIYVVLGAYYNTVYHTVKDEPLTIIQNKNWKNGIGTSIASASQYIMEEGEDYKGILFMLVDQPFITSEYLQKLISGFKPDENMILSTYYEPRSYGVPAVFDKTYLEALSQLKKDEGAKQIMKAHLDNVKVKMTEVDVTDLDTKTEYQKAYALNH